MKIKTIFFATLILLLCSFTQKATATKIDSLLLLVSKTPDSALFAGFKSLHTYYSSFAPDSALAIGHHGLKEAQKRGNKKFVVDMHIRLANSYIDISDYPNAQKNLTHALQLAEATANIRGKAAYLITDLIFHRIFCNKQHRFHGLPLNNQGKPVYLFYS